MSEPGQLIYSMLHNISFINSVKRDIDSVFTARRYSHNDTIKMFNMRAKKLTGMHNRKKIITKSKLNQKSFKTKDRIRILVHRLVLLDNRQTSLWST